MPSTRRRPTKEDAEQEEPRQEPVAAQHAEAEADAEASDDDAPEEIGLTSGRAQALQQSQVERQTRAALEEQRRTRRRALQERNEQQKRDKQGRREEATEELQGDGSEGGAEAAGLGPRSSDAAAAEGDDLLPADVLEALQQRRSLAEQQAALVSQALQQDQLHGVRSSKRRKVFDSLDKGPVKVQVLSAAKRIAAASRNNFKREHLMGANSRLKRSHEMLRPAGLGRLGPATKFK